MFQMNNCHCDKLSDLRMKIWDLQSFIKTRVYCVSLKLQYHQSESIALLLKNCFVIPFQRNLNKKLSK